MPNKWCQAWGNDEVPDGGTEPLFPNASIPDTPHEIILTKFLIQYKGGEPVKAPRSALAFSSFTLLQRNQVRITP